MKEKHSRIQKEKRVDMVNGADPHLDDYERWVEEEIERGNFLPVENFEECKERLEKMAQKKLQETLLIDPKVKVGRKLIEMIGKGQIDEKGGQGNG